VCAAYGAFDSGTTVFFSEEPRPQVHKLQLHVGSTEFMYKLWESIGKSPDVPRNCDREHREMTLAEAIEIATRRQIFVKPFRKKLFTGTVISRDTIAQVRVYDSLEKVFVYEPYDRKILSEWRVYVRRGHADGQKHCPVFCANYAGDPMKFPSEDFVKAKVSENSDFPSAYVMDVAVFKDGHCDVVEYNDMWAIGNYGLDNQTYYSMLKQRYFEIVL
jgi:hypothetical protein